MVLGRLQTDFSCHASLRQHPLKASVQFFLLQALLQALLQILYPRLLGIQRQALYCYAVVSSFILHERQFFHQIAWTQRRRE
jgi:hypothetical protein